MQCSSIRPTTNFWTFTYLFCLIGLNQLNLSHCTVINLDCSMSAFLFSLPFVNVTRSHDLFKHLCCCNVNAGPSWAVISTWSTLYDGQIMTTQTCTLPPPCSFQQQLQYDPSRPCSDLGGFEWACWSSIYSLRSLVIHRWCRNIEIQPNITKTASCQAIIDLK